jgi:hypothetical protein
MATSSKSNTTTFADGTAILATDSGLAFASQKPQTKIGSKSVE